MKEQLLDVLSYLRLCSSGEFEHYASVLIIGTEIGPFGGGMCTTLTKYDFPRPPRGDTVMIWESKRFSIIQFCSFLVTPGALGSFSSAREASTE